GARIRRDGRSARRSARRRAWRTPVAESFRRGSGDRRPNHDADRGVLSGHRGLSINGFRDPAVAVLHGSWQAGGFLGAASAGPEDRTPRSASAGRYRAAPVRRDVDADRKSTRLNSSHRTISYAVFCLKKKKTTN